LGAPPLPEEEEDPLIVAQRELEEAEKAREAAVIEIPPYDEEALKVLFGGREAEWRFPAWQACWEGLHVDHALYPAARSALQLSRCFPPTSPLQEFYTDLKDAEREGEVNRILSAFKLNPYEQLNLRNGASVEEVRRQYRKVRGRRSSTAPTPPWAQELVVTSVSLVPPCWLPPPVAGVTHGAPRQVQARAGQGRL
jgi:DnaJ family protein C protein 8